MIKPAKHPKNFAIVCNEVAKREDITARAKGIYYYLATLPEDWNLKQKEMYNHFVEGDKALRKAFNELIEKGYINRIARKDKKGKFAGNNFQVFWSGFTGLAKKGNPQNGQGRNGQALK